jgi:LacI family transcriptional regulator
VVHFFDIVALEGTMRQAAEEADALIVVAPRHPLIEDALEKIGRAKPLIALVTDLPGITRLAYVGLDNPVAGRVAGDLMGRLAGREGAGGVVVSEHRRARGARPASAPRSRAPRAMHP